ncbi:bifunctional adenosylcobinamide kinase/adenosylcobinamide-phosphate guanylyltransferase [Falsibacillus albus]|uniref:Adenosylcobinamide kinase n=1 Tax=Falsibacillus albus TaxID=2478915 RepID=A0A3L7JZP3_9BACI|nr:bifunctional adenosylcobinamide kinase/adenosylcobinamide-phosphate guanylyltransferase [Falsibacillus albus]RLQ96216.1 cobinamide kinase [Falsibacillus albus]
MGRLIFISGGVRSGKSSFAEDYAASLSIQGPFMYIATGVASDKEMAERITRHQKNRSLSSREWRTVEIQSSIDKAAEQFKDSEVVLLDCLTNLVNNELFGHEQNPDTDKLLDGWYQSILDGIQKIFKKCRYLIVVTNEVFQDIPKNNPFVHTYQRIMGMLHLTLVSLADEAYLVEFGRAVCMKHGKGEPNGGD